MSNKTTALVDVSILWDGKTSDLARQYYRRHLAGDSVTRRHYSVIPSAIQERLNAVGTTFDKLPGLLQRALVWDTGFVENGNFNGSDGRAIPLVGVKTLNGISMNAIAVTPKDFQEKTKCAIRPCNAFDYKWYKTEYCRSNETLSASLCLVDPFEDPGLYTASATWSVGGNDSTIPAMRLLNHRWIDYDNTTWNEVAAIHTSEAAIEPPFERCVYDSEDPSVVGPGSLVIPCDSSATVSATTKQLMMPPKQSEFVTAWLQEYSETADGGTAPTSTPTDSIPVKTSVTMIIGLACAGALVVVAVIVFWCRRRRSSSRSHEESQLDPNYELSAPTSRQPDAMQLGMSPTNKQVHRTIGAETRSTNSSQSSPSAYAHGTSTVIWQTLLDDPRLMRKQIPYENLEFGSQVSNGAYGEVWVGYWNREIVAIKRMLRAKQKTSRDIDLFVQEIQLTATLQHPNIVRFIGVSWNSPADLCMVVELLPAGDLAKILRDNGAQLTWSQHKLNMARGLASAVAYLHSQSPAIIHRDIKSKNVLLTNTLEPKIIDFGVSRRKMDDTMTAGVGTPYWTAPEVLEGLRYTEKSDIYSFGVLLTELDTCQIPYSDVKNEEGGMIHLKILNEVVAGKLRPSVSETCPNMLREVIQRCLHQDPASRPTASEVLWMLAK